MNIPALQNTGSKKRIEIAATIFALRKRGGFVRALYFGDLRGQPCDAAVCGVVDYLF